MFIRNKADKNKPGTRVQIVKSVRKGDKISQKIVRHVGTASSVAQLANLQALARIIIAEIEQAEEPQTSLLSSHETAAMQQQTKRASASTSTVKATGKLGVDLGDCREQSRIVHVGLRAAYGTVYEQLGFSNLLGRRRSSSNTLLKELMLARIA